MRPSEQQRPTAMLWRFQHGQTVDQGDQGVTEWIQFATDVDTKVQS